MNEKIKHPGRDRRSSVLPSLFIFLTIVFLGVASRFWLIDYPNIKPIAALALFAGFYFRQFRMVIAVVLSMMLISDLLIGTYEWQIAATVYGSILIAGGLGWLISRRVDRRSLDLRSVLYRTAGFAIASLAMSTVFFLLTNLATWACWYSLSWSGLAECFVAAIPFYRWTLAGDFVFSMGAITAFHFSLYVAACWKPAAVRAVTATDLTRV